MARDFLKDIRIGTMVKANAPHAIHYIKQILPLDFESIQPFFWQTMGEIDPVRLAGELRGAIVAHDVTISSLAMFDNPLDQGPLDQQTFKGRETPIIKNRFWEGKRHAEEKFPVRRNSACAHADERRLC